MYEGSANADDHPLAEKPRSIPQPTEVLSDPAGVAGMNDCLRPTSPFVTRLSEPPPALGQDWCTESIKRRHVEPHTAGEFPPAPRCGNYKKPRLEEVSRRHGILLCPCKSWRCGRCCPAPATEALNDILYRFERLNEWHPIYRLPACFEVFCAAFPDDPQVKNRLRQRRDGWRKKRAVEKYGKAALKDEALQKKVPLPWVLWIARTDGTLHYFSVVDLSTKNEPWKRITDLVAVGEQVMELMSLPGLSQKPGLQGWPCPARPNHKDPFEGDYPCRYYGKASPSELHDAWQTLRLERPELGLDAEYGARLPEAVETKTVHSALLEILSREVT